MSVSNIIYLDPTGARRVGASCSEINFSNWFTVDGPDSWILVKPYGEDEMIKVYRDSVLYVVESNMVDANGVLNIKLLVRVRVASAEPLITQLLAQLSRLPCPPCELKTKQESAVHAPEQWCGKWLGGDAFVWLPPHLLCDAS